VDPLSRWWDATWYAWTHFTWFAWLPATIGLATAVTVGVLARLSPRQDWEFIKKGPAVVLTAIAIVSGFVVPWWHWHTHSLYTTHLNIVCPSRAPLDRILTPRPQESCRVDFNVTKHEEPSVFDFYYRDFLPGTMGDGAIEAVGTGIGLLAGMALQRRRG
jgi:hypothetical protein